MISGRDSETVVLPRVNAPGGTAVISGADADTVMLPRVDAPGGTAVISGADADTVMLPRVDAPDGTATPRPAASPGWLRLNRWGLVALVPALLLALAPSAERAYDLMRWEPRRPAVAGDDGWVSFAGARMRLLGLVVATDLTDYRDRKFPLPEGIRAWRATLAFDAGDPSALAGCELAVEDQNGRIFGDNPAELNGSRAGVASCGPDESAARSPYERSVYFVLPESAAPVAVRITTASQLPRYARLSPG